MPAPLNEDATGEPPGDRPRRPRRLRFRRFSAVELLISLVLLFLFTPFVQALPNGRTVETALVTLVLLSGLLAVTNRRRFVVGALLAFPAVIGRWLNHFHPNLVPSEIHSVVGLLFIGFVIANLLRFVLRAPRVDHETLCAGIAAYLMMGLMWTMAYVLLAAIDPHSFKFTATDQTMDDFNSFYFSFVTLSTVGYGDITPISRGARMLAVLEATTGTFYITVLIARLVAIYSAAPKQSGGPTEGR